MAEIGVFFNKKNVRYKPPFYFGVIFGGIFYDTTHMLRTVSIFVIILYAFASAAHADIASAGYVREIVEPLRARPDWNQTDPDALDYIKNKPDNHETVANKITVLSGDATDEQYPSARAVKDALDAKADVNDARFNTIPTSQPMGTPPAGQVFIWFN